MQSALSGIFIQARLFKTGGATVILKDDPANPAVKDVALPEIHFDRNQMNRDDWQAIRLQMHQDFCYDPIAAPPLPPPPDTPKPRQGSYDRP